MSFGADIYFHNRRFLHLSKVWPWHVSIIVCVMSGDNPVIVVWSVHHEESTGNFC